ncbi:MAG: NUDIX hydrolase [Thermoanaerobaculia bacterium]
MSDETQQRGREISSRIAFSGRVIRVRVAEVELPGGRRATMDFVEHPDAAAIVPLTDDGEVIVLRQYRHATGEWLREIPAGKLDPGEAPEDGARRECAEESGWRPRRLAALGYIWTTPGFTNERIWLFLGRDLEPVEQGLDPDEVLAVERLPLREALGLAVAGGVSDGKSLAALFRAAAYLGVPFSPAGGRSNSS